MQEGQKIGSAVVHIARQVVVGSVSASSLQGHAAQKPSPGDFVDSGIEYFTIGRHTLDDFDRGVQLA